MPQRLDQHDYRRLAEFRYLLRCFLEFSETAASDAGLTPRQHQALLAIKGVPEDTTPTIGHLAERLRIRHHSAVELTDRLVEAGLITRQHDPGDRRRVRLKLTRAAEARLAKLSASHLDELQRLRPALLQILDRLRPDGESFAARTQRLSDATRDRTHSDSTAVIRADRDRDYRNRGGA
jgi:DNA-binding MarR family transcriptional regulator